MTQVEKRKFTWLAKAITFITTPALIGGLLLFYALYTVSPTTEIFYKTFSAVITFSIILPVLFIFFLIKKGHVSNFHMKERKDRVIPFGFTLLAGIISLLIVKHFETDPMLLRMFLTFFLMALGYSVITFLKYKISGHTFIFTSAILVLVFFLDLRFIYLLPLVLLIGWSRVYLKEHTLGEVAGGASYAVVSFVAFSLLFGS